MNSTQDNDRMQRMIDTYRAKPDHDPEALAEMIAIAKSKDEPAAPGRAGELLQENTWELLLRLAADQYNRGKHHDPAGDNFSTIVEPIHTTLLRLIDATTRTAVTEALDKVAARLPEERLIEYVDAEDDDIAEGWNSALAAVRAVIKGEQV